MLQKHKLQSTDSFEDVLWELYECNAELSNQTKRNIARSMKEAALGRIVSFETVCAHI